MDTTSIPLGQSVGPVEYYCDAAEMAAFGLAINDDNPMYQDGRAVPPTYAFVPGLDLYFPASRIPDEACAGGHSGGHGEHDLHIHKVPKPGSILRTTAVLESVVVNKVGMNVFTNLKSFDEAGELVYEQFWSTIWVGPVTGGSRGPGVPDATFPEEARARKVGTMVLGTTEDQPFRYAGASGDRSVVHVNDRSAAAAGSDRGKFMQGACTLGVASRALVAMAAGGDPNRIRRVAVRFSRRVYPGAELAVSVYDIGRLENGRHAYAFEAAVDGQFVLRNGRVEVEPA